MRPRKGRQAVKTSRKAKGRSMSAEGPKRRARPAQGHRRELAPITAADVHRVLLAYLSIEIEAEREDGRPYLSSYLAGMHASATCESMLDGIAERANDAAAVDTARRESLPVVDYAERDTHRAILSLSYRADDKALEKAARRGPRDRETGRHVAFGGVVAGRDGAHQGRNMIVQVVTLALLGAIVVSTVLAGRVSARVEQARHEELRRGLDRIAGEVRVLGC